MTPYPQLRSLYVVQTLYKSPLLEKCYHVTSTLKYRKPGFCLVAKTIVSFARVEKESMLSDQLDLRIQRCCGVIRIIHIETVLYI